MAKFSSSPTGQERRNLACRPRDKQRDFRDTTPGTSTKNSEASDRTKRNTAGWQVENQPHDQAQETTQFDQESAILDISRE